MSDFKKSGNTNTGDTVRKGIGMLVATIGILLVISWIFIHWDLDRNIAARFYSPESGWYLKKAEPWHWLYRNGTIPGIAITLAALIGAVITHLRASENHWRRYFLLVVLTSVLGAGLLVNGILKPYWGRPRPNQIQEFGGQYSYRHALSPGIPGKGKSFPCGHCTMGFIFISLVYFRRKSSVIAWIGGIGGLIYGGVISAARVVQGAHFVTDCIWSLGIIWLVSTALYYLVLKIPASERRPSWYRIRKQKLGITVFGTIISIVIVLAFLTRQPFFETYYFEVDNAQTKIRELRVGLENGYAKSNVRHSQHDPLRVLVHARGSAWLGASETQDIVSILKSGNVYQAVYRMKKHGYFTELNHDIEVVIPQRLKDKISVVFMDETGKPTPQ